MGVRLPWAPRPPEAGFDGLGVLERGVPLTLPVREPWVEMPLWTPNACA